VAEEVKGHPVEIELLRASKWLMITKKGTKEGRKNSTNTAKFTPPKSDELHLPGPLTIIKTYAFDSTHPTSCVIVQDTSTYRIHVFVKGPYESMHSLCDPDSLPLDYSKVTTNEAKAGFYVLAYGHREIVIDENVDEWEEDGHLIKVQSHSYIQDIDREVLESNMKFLGIVTLR
jgi:cation-transporting ATPase 13A3/4/5